MIQHSIPTLELELSWFPTYMKPEELRRLHRPYLKPVRTGPHSEPIFKPVYSLERYVRRKENVGFRIVILYSILIMGIISWFLVSVI